MDKPDLLISEYLRNNPNSSPIDDRALEKLCDPNTDDHKQFQLFFRDAGTAGFMEVLKANQDGHIDGDIGITKMGVLDHFFNLLPAIAKSELYVLISGVDAGSSVLVNQDAKLNNYIYVFTRREHINKYLRKNPDCECKQPMVISIKRIKERIFKNMKFGLYINADCGTFEIDLEPNITDMACDCAYLGKEKAIEKFLDVNLPPKDWT